MSSIFAPDYTVLEGDWIYAKINRTGDTSGYAGISLSFSPNSNITSGPSSQTVGRLQKYEHWSSGWWGDYSPIGGGSMIFEPGQTEVTVSFLAYADAFTEGTETLEFTIKDLGAIRSSRIYSYRGASTGWVKTSIYLEPVVIEDSSFEIDILDRPMQSASFSISDSEIEEGRIGSVVVTRSGDNSTTQTVRIGVTGGSAVAGLDYKEIDNGQTIGSQTFNGTTNEIQTLFFNPGESQKSLSIITYDNQVHGSSKTIELTLSPDSYRGNFPAQIADGTAIVTITDDDAVLSIYALTASASQLNEGSTLTTTVSTTNVTAGTTLHWSLSGTDINSKDISSGALTGSGTVSSNGGFSFSHGIANDLTTEGVEILEIKLFSDASRATQVATTSVTINDTSLTQTAGTTVANSGNGNQNVNIIEDSYVNYWSNTGTVNNGNMNSNNTTNNYTYNYYDSNNTNISNTNITNNVNSNNTSNSWNIYSVDNSVSVGDITSQWFNESFNSTKQSVDLTELKLLDITASTWADKILINRVAEASDTGGDLVQGQQLNRESSTSKVGSVLNGGRSNDVLRGLAAWDLIDGGSGDDLIHGGNGRDIIKGGAGSDELHGDFGWNTYKSEKDGFMDLVAVKSDQFLGNWWYGNAGNSPNGEKADIIEGLDSFDLIKIIGVATSDLSFRDGISHKGVTGIGIYAKGVLEALYTGGDLSVSQISSMTTGDNSAQAMANQLWSYWGDNTVPALLD